MGTAAGSLLSPTHRPPVVTQNACLLGFRITDRSRTWAKQIWGLKLEGDNSRLEAGDGCRCP